MFPDWRVGCLRRRRTWRSRSATSCCRTRWRSLTISPSTRSSSSSLDCSYTRTGRWVRVSDLCWLHLICIARVIYIAYNDLLWVGWISLFLNKSLPIVGILIVFDDAQEQIKCKLCVNNEQSTSNYQYLRLPLGSSKFYSPYIFQNSTLMH